MSYNGHTIATNQELAFDPPELSRWNHFWFRVGRFFRTGLGKAVAGFLFVAALALTVLTKGIFGALLFAVIVSVGLAIGAFVAGLRARDSGDCFWDGFLNHIRDNWAQSVAITGVLAIATVGVGAAVSGIAGAAAKKVVPNAVVIGENMARVKQTAAQLGAKTYKAMPKYVKIVSRKGETIARKMSMAHNEKWIKKMQKKGVKIFDIGLDPSRIDRSWFYFMESIQTRGYWNLFVL